MSSVIVTGMHRSGTSFAVRALNISGLWIGAPETLMTIEGRAFPGNQTGNYESTEAVRINNQILAESGGSWNQPPLSLRTTPFIIKRMERLVHELVTSKPSVSQGWGWKDPRTVLTLEAWK